MRRKSHYENVCFVSQEKDLGPMISFQYYYYHHRRARYKLGEKKVASTKQKRNRTGLVGSLDRDHKNWSLDDDDDATDFSPYFSLAFSFLPYQWTKLLQAI